MKRRNKAAKPSPRPHLQLREQWVENPDWSRDRDGLRAFPRKVRLPVNIKESAVSVLASKGVLDEAQVATAEHFRRLWERMGGAGARAIDPRKEVVDGGVISDPINPNQMDAGVQLNRARDTLIKAHGAYAWKLVGYVAGEGRSIHDLTETRRQRDTMTDNVRMYLDVLAEVWGYRTHAQRA